MDALKLTARREALGLDQATLAGFLGGGSAPWWTETATRDIPTLVGAKLDQLQLARDTIAGLLEDSLPGDLLTYATKPPPPRPTTRPRHPSAGRRCTRRSRRP